MVITEKTRENPENPETGKIFWKVKSSHHSCEVKHQFCQEI